MISWSYWPSTRVDIHPSRSPTWVPATLRPTLARGGSTGGPDGGGGVQRRSQPIGHGPQEPLERGDVGRYPTLTVGHPGRAGPASELSPVSASTRASASAVSSSKSGSSGGTGRNPPAALAWPRGSPLAQPVPRDRLGHGLLLGILQADDLHQVDDADPDNEQDDGDEDEERDP